MEFYSLVVLGTKPRAVIKGLGSVLPPPYTFWLLD